jgi:hypothetical protein
MRPFAASTNASRMRPISLRSRNGSARECSTTRLYDRHSRARPPGLDTKMTQLSKKKKYIVSELWILAWNASVQHVRPRLYNDTVKHGGAPDKRIADFKTAIIGFVTDKLLPHYLDLEKPCREEQHYKNIARLIQFANQKDPGVLGEDGYRYGVAQKLLNLMLKYLWCADLISVPPHCPVDRIVIDKTQYSGKAWTKIREESEYREIIEAIKDLSKAKQMSTSEWELNFYNRRANIQKPS